MSAQGSARAKTRSVQVSAGVLLAGDLGVWPGAEGIVLFAHGSGSSRFSQRNRFVAEALRERGIGTLLFDLLTADEEAADALTGHLRFDVKLLADRLDAATDWVRSQAALRGLPVGYFGASTGAAAALLAAARRRDVAAVVSRGGRADLAQPVLGAVTVPTLLIVGSADPVVRELNEAALVALEGPRELAVVPGAGHLFEEPGALEAVAHLAGEWFQRYLGAPPEEARPAPAP